MDPSTTLPPAIAELVSDVRARLSRKFGERLREIRLYGSFARGTAREDSDVDLLVVVDRLSSFAEKLEAMGEAIDAGLAREFLVQPVVYGVEEFERLRGLETAFARALDDEGIPV